MENENFNSMIAEILSDIKNGKNIHGPFNSVKELMDDLNSNDE